MGKKIVLPLFVTFLLLIRHIALVKKEQNRFGSETKEFSNLWVKR